MKKVLAIFIAALLIIPNTFAFTTSAQTVAEATSEFVVRTGASAWINDWNDSTRSVKLDLQGSLKSDYYYNCFEKYFEISVTNPEHFYSSPSNPYFYLKSKTDITQHIENGYLRFWISVPKDMTLNVELMSNESGSYGRSGIKISLSAQDSIEGYQEVQIPLKDFFGDKAYRNNCDITAVRYVMIGGGSSATPESFLNEKEVETEDGTVVEREKIRLSFFEIWSGKAPEPEPVDNTPVYYSKNGKYSIRDIYAELDSNSLISAFKDSRRKDDYAEAVKQFNEYASLLELYSVNLLTAGSSDYSTSQISNYVKVYIPLTEEMKKCELAVATAEDGVLTQRDFIIEDDSLVITTNQLGDILVMNTETPDFVSETKYYELQSVTVKDSDRVDKAILVNSLINAIKPASITSEGTATMPQLSRLCSWMEADNGILRFWVKVPWEKGTPEQTYKLDLCIKYNNGTSDAYPHTAADFTVKADGLWQEVRIPSFGFNVANFKAVLNNESYLASYSGFYCRVLSVDKAETSGLYFSRFDFYSNQLVSRSDNGNIERTAFVLDGKKQDYVSDVSVSTVTVTDNRFITTAKRITRKETTTDFSGKLLLPYSANISVASGEKYNQIADWFYNEGAEMRTYMKNESDSPVSFKIGLYGKTTYNSATVYPKAVTKSYITLPANSGWQEIRVKFSSTDMSASRIPEFTTTAGYVALEIYTKKNEFLQETGDSILVAPAEIYSHNIAEDVQTDFSDHYITAGVLENVYASELENVTSTVSKSGELPFFDSKLTVKAEENTSCDGKEIYLFAEKPVFADDFAKWAENPQAQMRFWIKSNKSASFELALKAGGGTITAEIAVAGSDNWQEIVLSRSDFSASSTFDNAFNYADTRFVYSAMIPNEETLPDGNEIAFSSRMEFFSGLAYSKGDANRDERVDLKDLVRVKRLSADGTFDFATSDIDSDGKLSATDLSYIRKWLLSNSWA